jgi:hypothetical protein
MDDPSGVSNEREAQPGGGDDGSSGAARKETNPLGTRR